MAEIEREAEYGGECSSLEARVIGICMGKEQKGLNALRWALDNIVPSKGFVYLLHVRSPLRWVPSPMGGKLPVDQVNPNLVKQFKDERFAASKKLVDGYGKLCERKEVTYELCYAENDSVSKELVDQICKLGITDLLLESTPSNFLKVRKKESISAYVTKYAPEFCTVMVIRKGKLYSIKDATQSSFRLSSHSISVASDLSISMASDSISSGESVRDDLLMKSGSYQDEGRGIQSDVKVDMCGTSHGRLQESTDISQDSLNWLMLHGSSRGEYQSPAGKAVPMSNYSIPPLSRLFDLESAALLHQEAWSPQGSDHSQSIGGFESRASLASDFGSTEDIFSENNSRGYGYANPIRVALETIEGASSISPIANARLYRRIDSPGCDALSQTSTEIIQPSNSSHTLEGSPLRTALKDLNIEFASDEVPSTFDFGSLQSQMNKAKQSAYFAQRQAERQISSFRMADEAVTNARKLMTQHERHQDEALNEAKFSQQKALGYEKRCEEAVATKEVALRDQEILQERLAEEIRRHQDTQRELEVLRKMVDVYVIEVDLARQQAQQERRRCEEALVKLEEVTKKLEEEHQLRKEAEQRASWDGTTKREALLALRKQQQKYTEYSFKELKLATDNFHEGNKLGEGGYGPVYRGMLHHTTVAIKVLASEGSRGRNEFQKEVEVLSCIRHPHMVMLLGACPEKGCVVYEYMANGSLEDRLNCRDGTPPLPWYVRFRICLEVATALLFLHSRPQPIIHCDLKPGNILLDHHFVSKVSDVGLAKLVPSNVTFSMTMCKESVIVGTLAYMDPDYQRTGVVSCESDLYSLGIVMLQLLTGRQAVGVVDLVEDALVSNKLEDVLDKSAGEWPLTEATALARVSLLCAEPRRKNRPNLETKILPDLESIQSVAGIAATSISRVGATSSGNYEKSTPCSRWFYL